MSKKPINALVIRNTKPISTSKLPDRSDSELRYIHAMREGSKALCQAVLDTGRTYEAMTEKQQLEAIAWAYDVKIEIV